MISSTHAVSEKTYNRSCQGYTKHKRNLSDEDLFDHDIAIALKDVCSNWDYIEIPVTYNKSLHCYLDWAILNYYYNYDPINHDPIYWIPWLPGYEQDSKLAAKEFRLQRGLAFCDANYKSAGKQTEFEDALTHE
ncbi:unnamed protein product [Cylicocyclus nassatus]|uniref:Uncharacterized protein n=1 Tax=Cylicocyclus nassatus TaxID=53992 RepID=A0AA36DPV4_CYLNA|nr:unnamed protein product [Cylicocyclus nassatus]